MNSNDLTNHTIDEDAFRAAKDAYAIGITSSNRDGYAQAGIARVILGT